MSKDNSSSFQLGSFFSSRVLATVSIGCDKIAGRSEELLLRSENSESTTKSAKNMRGQTIRQVVNKSDSQPDSLEVKVEHELILTVTETTASTLGQSSTRKSVNCDG